MLHAPAIAPIPQILFFGLCTFAFSSLSHNPGQNLQQYSRRSFIGGNQVKFLEPELKKNQTNRKNKETSKEVRRNSQWLRFSNQRKNRCKPAQCQSLGSSFSHSPVELHLEESVYHLHKHPQINTPWKCKNSRKKQCKRKKKHH
jgi:hypothetical protein